jgi:hypothetical protein
MHGSDHAREGATLDETRAIARLPGVDIAIIHTPAQAGQGERVTVMLQKTALPPLAAFDPVRMWWQMTQAAWAPWLAITGSLWALPRVMDRE